MFGGLKNILLFFLIGLITAPISWAQSDKPLGFAEKIDEVMNQHYFTSLDSCLIELNNLSIVIKKAKQWDQYLNVIVNKSWVAEHHKAFDSLYKFIEEADAVMATHQVALDSLDVDNAIRAEVIYNKGMLQYHSGNMRGAIDEFGKLMEGAYANGQDSLDAFSNYLNLGQLYYRIEDYENAGIHFRLAAAILPKYYEGYGESGRNYDYQLSLIQNSIGKFHFMKGKLVNDQNQLDIGLGYFHKALTKLEHRAKESSVQNLLLNVYQRIADYHKESEQYDSANYYIDKLLKVPRDNAVEQMKNRLYAGEVYLANNKAIEARRYFMESFELAQNNYPAKHYRVAQSLYHIGKTYAVQDEWETALGFYQKAIAALVEDFDAIEDIFTNPNVEAPSMDKELLEVLVLKAEALRNVAMENKSKGLKTSIDTYLLATNLIDKMRMGFQLTESRQFLAAKSLSIYESAVAASYDAYQQGLGDDYLNHAFYFVEKNKSRLILEGLTESAARKFAQIPQELLEKETILKGKLSLLKQDLFEQTDRLKQDELRKAIFQAQLNYNDFIKSLESSYPRYFNAKYNAAIPNLNEMQQTGLNSNEILIEYFYGEKAIYGIAMSKEKVVIKKLATTAALNPIIKNFVKHVSHFDLENALDKESFNAFNKSAYELNLNLIAPLISDLDPKGKDLTIIQDGLLGYIPFGVLTTEAAGVPEQQNYALLPYLIKSHNIGYGYSATLRFNEKSVKTDLTAKDYKYLGLAPSYPGFLASAYQPNKGGEARDGFSMLQNNQPEVESVASLFDGLKFLGSEASENVFKEYAPKSSVLHLSMHAFTNDQNPLYSALVFSNHSNQSASGKAKVENLISGLFEGDDQAIGIESANDGLLFAYELYNMNLQADLALLSACDTGVGELAKGEGIMSIGRAFKHAGCRNITMSLWKANDKTTSEIMKFFGSSLLEGLTIDKALRQSKLKYLEEADKIQSHPYFWATFITVGNNDPIDGSTKAKNYWLLIIFSAGLLLAAVYLFVIKGKTSQ